MLEHKSTSPQVSRHICCELLPAGQMCPCAAAFLTLMGAFQQIFNALRSILYAVQFHLSAGLANVFDATAYVMRMSSIFVGQDW